MVNKKTVMKNLSSSMKYFSRCVGLVLAMAGLLGCGEDPQQLFETAQFEEQQQNHAHARELYERILRDHATSPLAQKAEERLKDLQKEKL